MKKCHEPGAIGFSFASHWLQNRLLTMKTALYEPEWVQSCDLPAQLRQLPIWLV